MMGSISLRTNTYLSGHVWPTCRLETRGGNEWCLSSHEAADGAGWSCDTSSFQLLAYWSVLTAVTLQCRLLRRLPVPKTSPIIPPGSAERLLFLRAEQVRQEVTNRSSPVAFRVQLTFTDRALGNQAPEPASRLVDQGATSPKHQHPTSQK